eukprot:3509485-Prorocentrum_lima.AAC.1
MRKHGRNNIELCIIILCNKATRRLMHLLRLTVSPFEGVLWQRRGHGQDQERHPGDAHWLEHRVTGQVL